MNQKEVIIIGGGLAGLTAAIHLAKNYLQVTLFEKQTFPQHKVCGEYLSREVLPYLEKLEVPILDQSPKKINRLLYSTQDGKSLKNNLEPGGLGISRYALDTLFYETATRNGVIVKHEKVNSVSFRNGMHDIETGNGIYRSNYVLGAFGKRSVLDRTLQRDFFSRPAPWMGVKSHFNHPEFPEDLVALHSFKGGYCGLSKTETGAVNVCYLATYKCFKEYRHTDAFKNSVLRKNPFLNRFFSEATEIFPKPLSIAQVNFSPKSLVKDHVLMIGDAAGLIHPLCGNGMAMAIHSGKIASEILLQHLQFKTDRNELESKYIKTWKAEFHKRMVAGKWLQKILLNENLTLVSQSVLKSFPSLLPLVIKQTHGNPIF